MGVPISSPEQVREERETATAEREGRIEHRYRVSPPNNYAEAADRLAEVASVAFATKQRLGEICWSLMRCRERATENGYSDVVLALQPLIDKYVDLNHVATETHKAAMFEFNAFNVKGWTSAD